MGIIGSLTDREYQKFKEAADGSPAVQTIPLNQLIPEEYDAVNLSYSGSDITQVEYLTGGTGGTAVATLTLSYSGGNLVSIQKT
jgi:hypothetical protein